MAEERAVRVMLVDDHAMFRAGIAALFAEQPDFEIVGQAASAEEAIAAVDRARPDVVVMDVAMPGMGGVEGVRALHATRPEIGVLCLTAHDNPAYFFAVVEAGAAGYLLKEAAPSDLFDAVRAARRGEAYFCPTVARLLLNDYLRRMPGPGEGESFDGLSPREREVLALVAEGHSNREIAEKLVISVNTVAIHRAHVMQKLNMHDRAELTKYAIRCGLLKV